MAITQPFPIYPTQATVNRGQFNRRIEIPAPTGGWNTRDHPTVMPANDAVSLINLIPRHGFVEMRGGYESYSTGVGSGDVDLCVEYFDGSTRALITASSSNIYDSTAAGAASSLASGFTSGRWDTAMMNGIMGFVNGADAPQKYDGATVSAMTVSGSGLTATNLVGIHVHKQRSYFWETDGPSFWYSDTNALGGTLTEFPLGEVAKEGGRLLRMTTWTVDGGSGPDDYAVFIMSSGEVIVYQGYNPGSALAWGLVGIYKIGEPVSDRAITRYGPEIMVCVENDVIAIPSAFQQPTPPTTKLSGAISDAVYNFGGNPGWELFWFANEALMMLNVPVSLSPDTFEQYVLNTQTLAATRFIGLPARTWVAYNGDAYFGSTDGTVYRFNTVESDGGEDIDCTGHTAWASYGIPTNKMVTALIPTFSAVDSLAYDIRAGYSFVEPSTSSPSSTVSSGTPWGSPWGSSWGAVTGETILNKWRMSTGRGTPVSVKLQFSRQGDRPKWYKTDALVRVEGNL